MSSTRWKELERTAARKLRGRRFPRWLDFGQSAPDVIDVKDFPKIIVDCKAHRRFSHHTLLDTIREKYCEPGQVPMLVTKHQGQRGEYVTVSLDWLATLMDQVRNMNAAIPADEAKSTPSRRSPRQTTENPANADWITV